MAITTTKNIFHDPLKKSETDKRKCEDSARILDSEFAIYILSISFFRHFKSWNFNIGNVYQNGLNSQFIACFESVTEFYIIKCSCNWSPCGKMIPWLFFLSLTILRFKQKSPPLSRCSWSLLLQWLWWKHNSCVLTWTFQRRYICWRILRSLDSLDIIVVT